MTDEEAEGDASREQQSENKNSVQPEEQEAAAQHGVNLREAPEKKSGGRGLWLLLLLIIVVSAGVYYFGPSSLLPVKQRPKTTPQPRTKIKVPARPVSDVKSATVKVEVVSPEKITDAGAGTTRAKAPDAKSLKRSKPQPVAVAAFTLSSGSYLYSAKWNLALKQIKKQGFKIKIIKQSEIHTMTRLLVGRYPRGAAEKRMAAINKLTDGAFLVAEDGKFAVYAGSYISLDKARRAADLLYQQGVRVDERQLKISLPRVTFHFGRFSSRDEARIAAQKLQQAGVRSPRIISL